MFTSGMSSEEAKAFSRRIEIRKAIAETLAGRMTEDVGDLFPGVDFKHLSYWVLALIVRNEIPYLKIDYEEKP